MTWESQQTALEIRGIIETIADERINTLRPSSSYAVVSLIDRPNHKANVIYVGETVAVPVAMGAIEPTATGELVRIGGSIGHRYIEDVLQGTAITAGADERYAPFGGGGGGTGTTLDSLTDVDTATNLPQSGYFLGWDVPSALWMPKAHDHSTQFLSLGGGSLTGPLTVGTLNVTTVLASGALTAQTLAGSGTGLTNLSATNVNQGTLASGRLPATIQANTQGSAAFLTTGRTIQISGDATGSAVFDGSADINIGVTIPTNAIALGADTTGNYVDSIVGTTNQIVVNPSIAGEGVIATLSLPQSIHIAATPTFQRLILSQATGTAPFQVASTTKIPNLNADLLDDLDSAAFAQRGTDNTLTGSLFFGQSTRQMLNLWNTTYGIGIQDSTLYSRGDLGAGFAWYIGGSHANNQWDSGGGSELMRLSNTEFKYKGLTIWHAGNDGAGSGLDADTLDTFQSAYFAAQQDLEALLGDLFYVGLYNAAIHNGNRVSMTFNGTSHKLNLGNIQPAVDASMEARVGCQRPLVAAGGAEQRPFGNSFYLGFLDWGVILYILDSAGAYPYVWFNYPTGFPAVGADMQMRCLWNPTTDVLSIYWRAAGTDLLDDTGWILGASETKAGTQIWNSYGYATDLGGSDSGTYFNGRIDRFWLKLNSTVVYAVSGDDIPGINSTSFTPTTGPAAITVPAGLLSTTMPKPVWGGLNTEYRHGMYWVVASTAELGFIDSDLSGRYDIGIDDPVDVANGDWIIATDPLVNTAGHELGTVHPLRDMTFQYIPFSAETYVKAQIDAHLAAPDPHPNLLNVLRANALYSPVVHTHSSEITNAISALKGEADPFPIYYNLARGDVRYSPLAHGHNYEPFGVVAEHEAKASPHGQYSLKSEADSTYSTIVHGHDGIYSLVSHTHTILQEVFATDGAQSSRIFVGDQTPVAPATGDMWFEVPPITLQAPTPPVVSTAPTPTTVSVTWPAWNSVVGLTEVQLDRSPDGSVWTNILTDVAAPFDASYVDTGRAERTTYYYRVRGKNAAGYGAYSAAASVVTLNSPPPVVTGLVTSLITPTSLRLAWTAPAGVPANDPLHATTPYEVYRNGVLIASISATQYDFTGLVERTTYTVGVRTKDSANLVSALVSVNATTTNANPAGPTSPVISGVSHDQATLAWTASPASDLLRYRLYRNDLFVATTTGLNYVFIGLTPSTVYKLEVRAEDTGGLYSTDDGCFASTTTSVNPDTTPPANATITSYKPETSYGNLVLRFTCPADSDFTQWRTERGWSGSAFAIDQDWTNQSPGTAVVKTIGGGPYGAGQSVDVRVLVKDSNGNIRYGPTQTYALIATPISIFASAINSWRSTDGVGQYNAANSLRAYQGYYSNPGYNSIGLFYYGTQLASYSYGGRRTATAARLFFRREACGNSAAMAPIVKLHNETTSPGSVYNIAAPGTFGTEITARTTSDGATSLMLTNPATGSPEGYGYIPSLWASELLHATYGRRGVAVYDPDGQPYACFASLSENVYSGLIDIFHLG